MTTLPSQHVEHRESTPGAGATPRWLPPWDGALYAANTGHHRAHDAWFLASLPLRPSDRMADLGCGSGDFTRIMADLVPGGSVLGVDPQPSLLAEAAKVAAPNQTFLRGAVQDLDVLLPVGDDFDIVVSRAAFQWVPMADHPGICRSVFRLLKPAGWYRLDMGAAGNIGAIQPLMDEVSTSLGGPGAPWSFPDPGRYLEVLEAAGFSIDEGHVRTVAQRRSFTHDELVGWFHSQAFQAYEVSLPPATHAEFRHRILSRLDEVRRWDGSFDQTFVRMDVLVRKPG